jgi:5,10-methylenetetrahydromethanopterin reductase
MTDTARTSYGILATRLSGPGSRPNGAAEALVTLESLGIRRVWLPHLLGLDPLPVLAAAAARTSTIRFGTAVTPTWPRHPVTLMQEAFAVQAISEGRLTLGVGVSDPPTIRDAFGLQWHDPIGHLREYLTVCARARTGQVDFDGRHYRVHLTLTDVPPQPLPIIASALNQKAIETATELADGLITLLAPPSYLTEVVRLRIESRHSRADFSVTCCVPVAVTHMPAAAASAARQIYGPFRSYTGYSAMLRAAGCTDIADTAAIGDEETITAEFERYAAAGVTEIVAAPFPVPEDLGVIDRTIRYIAALSQIR